MAKVKQSKEQELVSTDDLMSSSNESSTEERTSVNSTSLDDPIPITFASIYVPFIGSINTKDNSFDARVDVDLTWPATATDVKNFEEDELTFRPSFVPDLVMQNAKKLNKQLVTNANRNDYIIKDDGKGVKINVIRVRCEGSFIEAFELEHFPFDIQDLKMSFTISFVNAEQAYFVLNEQVTSFCVLTRFTALPEWDFVRLSAFSDVKENFAYATSSIIVKRRPKTHLLKVGTFSLLPNYMALLAYVSAPEEFATRVGTLITLFLALTAVLFVLQNTLPVTSKMTWLDQLLFGSLCVLSFILVCVTISAAYPNAEGLDRNLCLLSIVAAISHSLYFVFKALRALRTHEDYLLNPVERYKTESSKPTMLWEGEDAEAEKIKNP